MAIKKEIYIIISAFLLVASLLVLFFIFPTYSEVAQKSRELVSQKNNRLALESQFSEAKKFKLKYDEYKPNLEKIDGLFVDSENPVGFIEFLEETAEGFGLKLQISAPLFSEKESSNSASFQLSATGNFSGLLNFIQKLEFGPYLINLQNLDIKNRKIASQEKNQTESLNAEILIKVFTK